MTFGCWEHRSKGYGAELMQALKTEARKVVSLLHFVDSKPIQYKNT